jgi:hypothetical protein
MKFTEVILAYSDLIGIITSNMLTDTTMGSAWDGSTCGGFNNYITACQSKPI